MDEPQTYNKIRNYLIENNITIDSIIDNIKLLGNIQTSTDLIKNFFNKEKEKENTTINITTLEHKINILNQKIDEQIKIQDENEKIIKIIKNKLISQENKLLEQEKIINNMEIKIQSIISIINIIKIKEQKIQIEEPEIKEQEIEEPKIEIEEPEIEEPKIEIEEPEMKEPEMKEPEMKEPEIENPDVKLKEMFSQFEIFGKKMAINFIKSIKF